MASASFALVSRHILYSDSVSTRLVGGALLISGGLICGFIPMQEVRTMQLNLHQLRQRWIVEDLGDLYVTPGLVDFNVHSDENFEGLTRSAVAGGVTTLAIERIFKAASYCDIVPIVDYRAAPCSDIFAVRVKIDRATALGPALAQAASHSVPILMNLDWQDDASPLHVLSPYRVTPIQEVAQVQEFLDEFSDSSSDTDSEGSFDNSPADRQAETPETKDTGALRRSSLKMPTYVKPFTLTESTPNSERKRVSLPNILGFNSQLTLPASPIKPLSHLRRFTAPQVPAFADNFLTVSRADYTEHLARHPEAHEHLLIEEVLRLRNPSITLHLCNISSSESVVKLRGSGVTCDSSVSHLYFNDASIKPGDTRLKCVPPIRSLANQAQLIESLGRGYLTCVTSFHRSVAPALKFLGDFKTAPSGLNVVGCTLQAMWTLLRKAGCSDDKIIDLCEWTSAAPARILGISQFKGSISVGKHADLVIWDPYEIAEVPVQNPETCPFKGEQMLGAVHRTYIRGQLAYCKQLLQPVGISLAKQQY